MGEGTRMMIGVEEPKRPGEEEDRGDGSHGHVPAGGPDGDQDEPAEEMGERDPTGFAFPEGAEGGVGVSLGQGTAGGGELTQAIQRRRLDDGIPGPLFRQSAGEYGQDRMLEGDGLLRVGPLRELEGKGEEQQGVAGHRGIEQVVAEPTVKLLGEDDGDEHPEERDPPGRERWHAKREQPCGDQGAAVPESRRERSAKQAQDARFQEVCEQHGERELQQHPAPKTNIWTSVPGSKARATLSIRPRTLPRGRQ